MHLFHNESFCLNSNANICFFKYQVLVVIHITLQKQDFLKNHFYNVKVLMEQYGKI